MPKFSFHSYLQNLTSLICLPIHFNFVFVSFSFHLSLSSNFTLSQVGPNILFIYSLTSIHFQSCFKHRNPCFTTLRNQMLSFVIGSNFHTFHPCQPQQPLIFCTTHYLINCMQRKYISAVLWQNPIKHLANIHQMYSTVFIGLSYMERIFTSPPQRGFPHNSFLPIFFIIKLQAPSKRYTIFQ